MSGCIFTLKTDLCELCTSNLLTFYRFQFGYSRAGTGVFLAHPRESRGFVYRCSIDMGHAPKSWELIDEVLKHFMSVWPGDEYR